MQFKFKLVTCNKSFFFWAQVLPLQFSNTHQKTPKTFFYCNLNSDSLKNWNSHTQMQPAIAKYNIPNWGGITICYIFLFSCIASQKIRRHVIAGTWVAIWSTQLQLRSPSRILKEKHCSQHNIKCGGFVLQYTPSWGKTCTEWQQHSHLIISWFKVLERFAHVVFIYWAWAGQLHVIKSIKSFTDMNPHMKCFVVTSLLSLVWFM